MPTQNRVSVRHHWFNQQISYMYVLLCKYIMHILNFCVCLYFSSFIWTEQKHIEI